MSLKISKNYDIKLTRGDTAYIEVSDFAYDDGTGEVYTLGENDKVYFRLKGLGQYIEKELEIVLSNNTALLTLNPADTKDLDFETYKYELELVTSSDEHLTFVENRDFTIGVEQEE